jgi:hypothetical protein
MYDYLPGGLNNFAADRAAAVENRRFLARAVRFLAAPGQGIEQFLDIGAGLVPKHHWRPAPGTPEAPTPDIAWAGVARKN